ncbi:MAG: hypothetical protein M3X11_14560 [Acidobacteriota bacterium]|nr:hypothetical protein [Acidobacteriota bacterium]
MTSIEREKMAAIAHKAKAIRDVWLREREEARAIQISANAEVRRGWRESDNWDKAKPVSTPTVSSKGAEGDLQRLPTWLQYVSDGIAQRVRAVASRLQIDRAESTAYVMNLIHRMATGN